jgi:hypothetical protein
MKREEVFEQIAQSVIYGNLGLFIGSGLPIAVLNRKNQNIALSWQELMELCAHEFKISSKKLVKDGDSFPAIASKITYRIAEKKKLSFAEAASELKKFIASSTSYYPDAESRKPYENYFDLLSPSWIITTNYDLVIESILLGKGFSLSPTDQLIAPKSLIPVFHLHGIRTNPNSIIITQEDYVSLFRPNQYRQQKLAITIKESLTLLIGYNLGDFNVLTAMDWSKNVFGDQNVNHPHDIIQLYYNPENTSDVPYRGPNDVTVLEFSDLSDLLDELTQFIQKKQKAFRKDQRAWIKLNDIFKDDNNSLASEFIDDVDVRSSIINNVAQNPNLLIGGFLSLFSRSIDITWQRARPSGAFYAYNENLIILLDILEKFEITSMHPALLEAVVYNLNQVSSYIGMKSGDSFDAYRTWRRRKKSLPENARLEIINMSKTQGYTRLLRLLDAED